MSQSQALTTTPSDPRGVVDIVADDSMRGMVPRDMNGLWRMATMVIAARMAPPGIDSPEKVCLVVQRGFEVGLQPLQALEGSCIIQNKVCFYGDVMMALVQASGKLEDVQETREGEGESMVAVCRVKRVGQSMHEARYSVARAKQAGLWNSKDNWKKDPERMLQMRARSYALRDRFADVLKGVQMAEAMDDEPPSRAVTGAPAASSGSARVTAAIDALPGRDATGPEVVEQPPAKRPRNSKTAEELAAATAAALTGGDEPPADWKPSETPLIDPSEIGTTNREARRVAG